jgi:NCAIR mutase (PurE)-related protein
LNREQLRELMEAVQGGQVTPDAACERLKNLPFEDLGFAKVDHHRSVRTGMPEVIYSKGKTADQVAQIFASLAASGVNVLATRASQAQFEAVLRMEGRAIFEETAGCITLR